MKSPQEQLSELEDRFILGEILESDYTERKRELLKEVRELGETIQGGTVQVAEGRDSIGVPFCYVPPGPFYFGPDDRMNELQCPIYISKYPVTVAQFTRFLEESSIDFPDEDLETLQLVSPEPDCPVSHISYNDAKEYCRWLRRVTNEYYSLPHEVEWEKSARGEDGRYYPWGNEPLTPERACYQGEQQYACTVPVTLFEERNRSPYGCVDMVGNTWEWCLDSFDDERDPHILRGGSWCNEGDYANCMARTFTYPPDKRIDYGGLRVIYLPHDMLVEYRNAYADFGNATKASLRVVSISKSDDEKKGKPNQKLSALSKALDAAAAAAAHEDEPEAPAAPTEQAEEEIDPGIQDALAQAISSAADQYLRKDKNADTGVAPEAVPSREQRAKALEFGTDKAPKYKSIAELRAERETKAVAKQKEKAAEQDGKSTKTLEFDEEERMAFEKAKPAEIPSAWTQAALAMWIALLLGILVLFAYRLITL